MTPPAPVHPAVGRGGHRHARGGAARVRRRRARVAGRSPSSIDLAVAGRVLLLGRVRPRRSPAARRSDETVGRRARWSLGVFRVLFVLPGGRGDVWNGRTLGKMRRRPAGGDDRGRHRCGSATPPSAGARHRRLRPSAPASSRTSRSSSPRRTSASATSWPARSCSASARPTGRRRPSSFPPPPGYEAYAASLDVVAPRPPTQYALVRSFLLRVHAARPRGPAATGRRAGRRRRRRSIGATRPPGSRHPRLFLVAVAAAYQRPPRRSRRGPRAAGALAARLPRRPAAAATVVARRHRRAGHGCGTGAVRRRRSLGRWPTSTTPPPRPCGPRRVEAMLPFLGERLGNPSGAHRLARDARRALDDARDAVAEVARVPSPARSCSRAAAPRPTTSPSSACSTPPTGGAPPCARPSSTTPCSTRSSTWRAGRRRSTRRGLVDLDALADALDARRRAGVGDAGQQRGRA